MGRPVVVDASVAIKWILLERGSDAAATLLLEEGVTFHAPELCVAELANVVWKRTRRGEFTAAGAADEMQRILDMPLLYHGHEALASAALVTALERGISVYDALYVTLARSLAAVVVTADANLAGAGGSDADWPVVLL